MCLDEFRMVILYYNSLLYITLCWARTRDISSENIEFDLLPLYYYVAGLVISHTGRLYANTGRLATPLLTIVVLNLISVNVNICSHFLSFLNTKTAQILKLLPRARLGPFIQLEQYHFCSWFWPGNGPLWGQSTNASRPVDSQHKGLVFGKCFPVMVSPCWNIALPVRLHKSTAPF